MTTKNEKENESVNSDIARLIYKNLASELRKIANILDIEQNFLVDSFADFVQRRIEIEKKKEKK